MMTLKMMIKCPLRGPWGTLSQTWDLSFVTEEEPAKIPGADPSSGSAGWV